MEGRECVILNSHAFDTFVTLYHTAFHELETDFVAIYIHT